MGTGERGAAILDLFGQRAGPAFAALLGQGSRRLRQFTRDVRENEGATKSAAAVMMQGWEGAKREMWSAYEGLQIAFGTRATEAFTPALRTLTRWLGEVTSLVDSLDRRVTIFQRLGTGARAFFQGLGFEDAGSALKALREFAVEGVFGSTDPAKMVRDTEIMGANWMRMKGIGQDVRAFIDDVSIGNLQKAVKSVWAAFSGLPGMGQVVVLGSAAWSIRLLAGAATALALSPIFRAGVAIWGIGLAIDMLRNVSNLRELVDALKDLSGLELAVLGLALWGVGRAVWSMGSGVLRLARAIGVLKGAGTAAAVARGAGAGGGAAGAAAGVGAGLLATAGKWGSMLLKGGSLAGLTYLSWQGAKAARETGAIAGGKYYTGKDDAALSEMQAREQELVDQITEIRERGGFFPDLTENEIRPLAEQLELLRQRIEATRLELEHTSRLDSFPSHSATMMPYLLANPDTAIDPIADLKAIEGAVREGSRGTQKVHVQNPVRPNVTIQMHNTFNNVADPEAISRQLGDRVRRDADGYLGDGPY